MCRLIFTYILFSPKGQLEAAGLKSKVTRNLKLLFIVCMFTSYIIASNVLIMNNLSFGLTLT